ncbi:hypothetical protein M8994_18465 [Brucella sp. 21LCYQ03]|nr:hypothetical protein [Brucella sp. 21LCYQ03]
MAVYNAGDGCRFTGRKILFDTNVYIFIDGYDGRPKSKIYSDYYFQVLKEKKNEVVINDYILGEFFNRSCKDHHNICAAEESQTIPYKKRRNTPEFIEFMETIRDSCLHFIEEAQFHAACDHQTNIIGILEDSAKGRLDFSDIIIRNQCSTSGIVLVTDDFDYIDCSIDVVTANERFLNEAASRGTLTS